MSHSFGGSYADLRWGLCACGLRERVARVGFGQKNRFNFSNIGTPFFRRSSNSFQMSPRAEAVSCPRETAVILERVDEISGDAL